MVLLPAEVGGGKQRGGPGAAGAPRGAACSARRWGSTERTAGRRPKQKQQNNQKGKIKKAKITIIVIIIIIIIKGKASTASGMRGHRGEESARHHSTRHRETDRQTDRQPRADQIRQISPLRDPH